MVNNVVVVVVVVVFWAVESKDTGRCVVVSL